MMDFEEHEEQEEEMEEVVPVALGEQPSFETSRPKMGQTSEGERKGINSATTVRYRECLKNHAVGMGGHATDGCGEFMPSGEEGTLDALKCAACNCHRNFHRKEVEGELLYHQPPLPPPPPPPHHHHHHHQFSPYYRAPPPAGYLHFTPSAVPQQLRPLALPAASGGAGLREDEDMSNPSSSGGGGGGGSGVSKKRSRTKFTQEQKERMLEFAERLGWRIQKHDEAAVEQFSAETGVQRHVLKVWMHNNKHTLGKN